MNPIKLIQKYYDPKSKAYDILVTHSRNVTQKALEIAKNHPEMNIDLTFLKEAAMLHDIGIFLCDAESIGCTGQAEYICHGVLGAQLLRKEGLPKHALVCERHTGVGLLRKDIITRHIPIPQRDFKPISIEEQLICFADKFFSKTKLNKEKKLKKILKSLSKHGESNVIQFIEWYKLFLGKDLSIPS